MSWLLPDSRMRGYLLLLIIFIATGNAGHAQKRSYTASTGMYLVVDKGGFPVANRPAGYDTAKTLFIDTTAICTSVDFSTASSSLDSYARQPVVNISLNAAGARKFAAATKRYIGRRLAIIVNGEVLTAPTIVSEISGGQIQIAGSFTRKETEDIALRIRSEMVRSHFAGGPASPAGMEAIINRLDNALQKKDTAALAQMLHRQLSFGHSNGMLQSKQQALDDLAGGKLAYRSIKHLGQPEFTFVENIVSARRQIEVQGALSGLPFAVRLSVLEIWIDTADGWQLLSRQSIKFD